MTSTPDPDDAIIDHIVQQLRDPDDACRIGPDSTISLTGPYLPGVDEEYQPVGPDGGTSNPDNPFGFAILLRRQRTAQRVGEILGLTEAQALSWSDLRVSLDIDKPATVTVEFLVTPEQLHALVDLAHYPPTDRGAS